MLYRETLAVGFSYDCTEPRLKEAVGGRCFRHQMLLGGKTHSPNMEADRLGRVEEPEYDIP